MQHQRRAPRLELSFPVLVERGGEITRHRAANVSERGLLFLSHEPFPVGSRLTVTFSLPGTDVELAAQVEVIHITWDTSEPPGLFRVGVHFLEFEQGALNHPPLRALPC